MRDVRKVLAAVALGTTAALAAPAMAWAAPAPSPSAASTLFTGFASGRFGATVLSTARDRATAKIVAAGLQVANCFEVSNDVEFNSFSGIWSAESIWQCVA